MRIDRIWAMPNKWTFRIEPIQMLIKEEVTCGLWIDPFAGATSPASLTNDLNPEMPARFHLDALEFMRQQVGEIADGVIYDPPYSIRQADECYSGYGKEKLAIDVFNMAYWAAIKDEMTRAVKFGGKVICCGWNSMGCGLNRGFRMDRILLVPHGGSKNDTIVTVETKVYAQGGLFDSEVVRGAG